MPHCPTQLAAWARPAAPVGPLPPAQVPAARGLSSRAVPSARPHAPCRRPVLTRRAAGPRTCHPPPPARARGHGLPHLPGAHIGRTGHSSRLRQRSAWWMCRKPRSNTPFGTSMPGGGLAWRLRSRLPKPDQLSAGLTSAGQSHGLLQLPFRMVDGPSGGSQHAVMSNDAPGGRPAGGRDGVLA